MLKIQLKPGIVGYFDQRSNAYLTIDRPIAEIADNADISDLKKSYKKPTCSFNVVEGSLDDEVKEVIKAKAEIEVQIPDKEIKVKASKPQVHTNEDAPKPKRTRKKKEE